MTEDEPSLKRAEGEREGEKPSFDGSTGGPTPQRGQKARRSTAPKPKKHSGGVRRGQAAFDPDMKRLVMDIGKGKIGPDVTAIERHYSRSLAIRSRVLEFLLENEGSTWADLSELYARAANHAGCASETAHRWVHQFTRVGAGFRLLQAIDYWVLERRE